RESAPDRHPIHHLILSDAGRQIPFGGCLSTSAEKQSPRSDICRATVFLLLRVIRTTGDSLVSTYEVLSQLTLPNLKKIAKRLGIHVKQGLSGFIAGQAGLEIRRPYIQALATSNLVTLEEIDRILGT